MIDYSIIEKAIRRVLRFEKFHMLVEGKRYKMKIREIAERIIDLLKEQENG